MARRARCRSSPRRATTPSPSSPIRFQQSGRSRRFLASTPRPVAEPPVRPSAGLGTPFPALGLRLDEMTPALVQRFGLDRENSGLVVIGVTPDRPADRGGLEGGMG